MKVLIANFDLFRSMGGGQTFYRRLITNNPDLDFYYFRSTEPLNFPRPKNATPIPYKLKYSLTIKRFYGFTPPPWMYGTFSVVSNMAASVAGQSFDVVDIPDYEQYGTLIRPALEHHNVSVKRIVLSMHGQISKSIRLNWATEGMENIPLDLQEKMQYSAVDARYGISKAYLDEWREIIDLESHYLNPLHYFPLPTPKTSKRSNQPPSIHFVGRKEKCKGPDIFVELAWWLPRSSFRRASLIGPDSYDPNGLSSSYYLGEMTRHRAKDIKMIPAVKQDKLTKLFSMRSLIILPSRADTFNLIAFESLFSGCPTAIGSGAGIVRFLKETFPEIPLITIDINNIYACLPEIHSVLSNYDDYRQHLLDILLNLKEPNIVCSNIESVYSSSPVYDSKIRDELDNWYSKFIAINESLNFDEKATATLNKAKTYIPFKEKLKRLKNSLPKNLSSTKKLLINNLLSALETVYGTSLLREEIKAFSRFDWYKGVFYIEESNQKLIGEKVKGVWGLASNYRVDRIRVWREIARLEFLRGNEVAAVSYLLRAMRLLGHDKFGDLPTVVSTLETNAFGRVALVAEAMFNQSPEREQRCTEILEQALVNNQQNQQWEYEFVDDRRELSSYRVSVIVSLYKAAKKLPLFLEALQHQTMIKAGKAEVILVDSGSPDDEYQVFQQCITGLDMPIVYARCAERETIQSAWNRGIALSRSPYLAFLGVDEAILPDCLEVLAAELDADSSLDWVLGSSVVTNVDKHGNWVNDIMSYDRKEYRQDLVYLDTCYLSYVGGLYRRSIHDRFGYYDSTFTAAGDTEFKNRVLPFLKTKSIPRTLGIFWNYPEERTTQHPRAEIEDLRAWYLHRSLAGVKYAFATREPEEVEQLFYQCLKYRKSFCRHWSTDVELASNLATLLQEKRPDSQALKYVEGIKKLLDAYRGLEIVPKPSALASVVELIRINKIVKEIEQQHQAISNHVEPMYQIFNDNRYEQHSNVWLTDL